MVYICIYLYIYQHYTEDMCAYTYVSTFSVTCFVSKVVKIPWQHAFKGCKLNWTIPQLIGM